MVVKVQHIFGSPGTMGTKTRDAESETDLRPCVKFQPNRSVLSEEMHPEQIDRETDRQTDGQTDKLNILHYHGEIKMN